MKLGQLIDQISVEHKLPPEVVTAVICRESNGNTFATRWEQAIFLKVSQRDRGSLSGFVPREVVCTVFTEKHLRAFSWGLMQVLGETARVFGLKGDIGQLVVPAIGIEYGCRVLANKLTVSNGSIEQALLKYNGGGDKSYPDKVKIFIGSSRALEVRDMEVPLLLASSSLH